MKAIFFYRRLMAIICATLFLMISSATGYAQDVSASHLSAARKAISAIGATDQFDEFLPNEAANIKLELISNNPNLESVINKVVDEQAIALAKRRGDLEAEAARIYAKYFTEEELNQITVFYQSNTGKKLLKNGPLAMGDTLTAFYAWRQGVGQELAMNIRNELNEIVGKQ